MVGWLTRLTLVLGVLGLLGFDAVALGVGRLSAEDHAQQAAREAVRTWQQTPDIQRAYEAALTETDPAAEVIAPASFSVSDDGAVTLTLTHTSTTLVLSRIGPLRSWATSSATVTRRPAT